MMEPSLEPQLLSRMEQEMDPATADRSRFLDAEATVVTYRHAIAKRDAAASESARAEFDRTVKQLRKQWCEWQGEDSLHEIAFGEPIE
jgi:hypothetical protein